MGVSEILVHVDREIALLKQARALLAEDVSVTSKKGAAAPAGKKAAKKPRKKRKLSAEGRKAIADAAKRRWAEKRKAAGK